MKKGRGKAKGNAFERHVCRLLSLWWTQDERDDVFYRTASSGGRATARSKQGKKTVNHHGDVSAADPCGAPLTGLLTIEIKRGYSRASIHDALDRSEKSKPSIYEQWFTQAQKTHEAAGTWSWLVIVKRDQKRALVFSPEGALACFGMSLTCTDFPAAHLELGQKRIIVVSLEGWFNWMSRLDIEAHFASWEKEMSCSNS